MKNFKEKILKTVKRKNCFIALLLVALIAFGIVTGLKGSNSANSGAIKANAFTEAPQPKNLDLNGIRYTYQTSLNELRNDYGILNYNYNYNYMTIDNSNEGNTILTYRAVFPFEYTEDEYNTSLDIINQSIEFYFNDIKNENSFSSNEQTFPLNNYPSYEFNEIDDFDNLSNIIIDFNKLDTMPRFSFENYNSDFIVSFYYLSNDFDLNKNSDYEYIINNSVIKSFYMGKKIKYNFNLEKIEGYSIRNIFVAFADTSSKIEDKYIKCLNYDTVISDISISDSCAVLDNINFIKNNEANILTFNQKFSFEEPIFKGNLLLSETNYDKTFINDISSPSNSTEEAGRVNLSGGYFGGKFNDNSPSGTIYIKLSEVGFEPVTRNILYCQTKENYYGFMYNILPLTPNAITYFEQNRLLYLENANTLKGFFKDKTYDGLAPQVEDILYNVQYVGDIEEIERNEKIEEDFENLLKLTGLGAVIGLLFGLLFGNPVLGLIVGALFGFFTALFPLLIDGLQAIFGNNFLSGLYNLFKSITNFFGRIVDTFINFLMNIITNPFILILIVIIAIIYIVKRYNK